MKYHLIPVRMVIILKKKKITKVGEDVKKLEPLCIIGRNANSTATMVNCIEVLQKIKNRNTI